MNQRERHDPDRAHEPQLPESGDPAGGSLEAIQKENAAFLKAASSIIKGALSNNSTAFLAQNRQQGGQ